MNRSLMFVCIAFVLGFAIAWTGKPQDQKIVDKQPQGVPANDRPPTRESRKAAQPSSSTMDRIKGYMRKIDETKAERGYSVTSFDKIPTGDIPLLIEHWSKRAGFSGLDYSEQHQIQQLVKGWYEKEPDTVLAWVAGMESRKDRQGLLSEIVGTEAKRDFSRAMQIAKQYGTREQGGLDMPHEVREKLDECDPAQFMEILSAFPSDGSGSTLSDVNFKENFDFAQLASLMDKDLSAAVKQSYSFTPQNFVTEWTKANPDAAWQWLKDNNGGSPFNDTHAFFKSLAEFRTKEQISAFVIEQMGSRTDDEAKFSLAWQALTAKPDAGQIADFMTRLPGERISNLERLAETSANSSGGEYDEFKNLLVSEMTPEERRIVVPKAFSSHHGSDSRNMMARTLRQLGHTSEEINEMLPPAKP